MTANDPALALSESTISDALDRSGISEGFSGVVRLRVAGETMFERAFGFAQRAERIPNRMDTRFPVASGSKVFTATAVLQLVEAGCFELDTPLAEVLDTPYELDPSVTIRHLLTHTSGLHDYFDEEFMSAEDCLEFYSRYPAHTLLGAADYPLELDRPAVFPPGERFRYSNGAYVALAGVVEQQSSLPFGEYVRRHVFEPAGMRDSGYFRSDELPARAARGYVRQPDGSCRSNVFVVPVRGSGDGGAYVSAPDWGRFWDALYGDRLLARGTREEMIRPQVDTGSDPAGRHYGLGVWIEMRDDAVHERFVMGCDFGVGMLSSVYPRCGVELTILDNLGECVWTLRDVIGGLIHR